MSLIDKLKKFRNDIIVNMSKVTCEHIPSEEMRIKEELNTKINYDEPDRFSKQNNKSNGQVDHIKVREVSNGEDKYSVNDLLYSYHYDGRTDAWQYGIRVENKDVQVRKFSVANGEKTSSLVLKKVKGNYQEYGDSKDSGNIEYCSRNFSEYSKTTYIPDSIDLTNVNAIRYEFRKDKEIAHFLDKYVIVTPDERKSYKAYEKEQDKLFVQNKVKQDKLFDRVNK